MAFKIKKTFFSLLFVGIMLLLFILIKDALAVSETSTAVSGLESTVAQGDLPSALSVATVNQYGGGQFLSTRLGQLIGGILSFVGVLLLILIIYAGFMWMTAAGNTQKVDKAKDLIVSAIIGLIIILAAYAITAFIGRQLTETGVAPANQSTSTGSTGGS